MSYSFQSRAPNKAIAKMQVTDRLAAEVVALQPLYAIDQAQAEAAAHAFIDLLPDDDTQDVVVTVNGSLMGTWDGQTITALNSASFSVTAYLAKRETPAAT